MRSSRIARAAALLAVLWFALAPERAGAEAALDLRYELSWGGLNVATVTLHHEVQLDEYTSEAVIESVGLIDSIVRYRNQMQSTGRYQISAGLTPVVYVAQSRKRAKKRTALLEFDPDTGDVAKLKLTKRGKAERSDVPEKLRQGVVDPLTALFQVRDHAARARRNGATSFAVAVFDGHRRYDVEARLEGRERVRVGGRTWRALRLEATLVPVAGFDDDELRKTATGPDGLAVEVLLSDDRRLLPLQVRTLNSAIPGAIRLLEDCSGETGCQIAAR